MSHSRVKPRGLAPSPVYPQQYPHWFKHNTMKDPLTNKGGYKKKSRFLLSEAATQYTRFLLPAAANGTSSNQYLEVEFASGFVFPLVG